MSHSTGHRPRTPVLTAGGVGLRGRLLSLKILGGGIKPQADNLETHKEPEIFTQSSLQAASLLSFENSCQEAQSLRGSGGATAYVSENPKELLSAQTCTHRGGHGSCLRTPNQS